MLFSHRTAYKVITWYTLYQLVYGLHPLMPIEYIMRVVGGNEKDNTSMRVLTNIISKLEKLQEARMKVVEITNIQQWNRALWNQQKNPKK
jgi:hypothetical protein